MYYWFNLPTRLKEDLKIEELPCCGFVEEYNKKLETLEWGNITIVLNDLVEMLRKEDCFIQENTFILPYYYFWNIPVRAQILVDYVKSLKCPS